MDKRIKIIELCSKTGVFFGGCDGDYSESERNFVSSFLKNLKKEYTIDEETEAMVNGVLEKTYTIEEIIDETNQMLEGLTTDEKKQVKELLSQFIDAVIKADGVLDPNEIKFYNQWNKSVIA